MAADGVSQRRDRVAVGDQPADGGEAGRGGRAAELFAGAGGLDARSVRAGAARADRGLAEDIKAPRVTEILRDDYGYAGSVDLVRKRLAAAAAAGASGRRSGRATGRGR